MGLLTNGVFVPLPATLWLQNKLFRSFPVNANIKTIEQFAGATPGTALVTYPSEPADNTTRQMGSRAWIKIGGSTVFRGAVAHGPFAISVDQDEVQLVLVDDKWRMAGNKIGQYPIGTQGSPAGSLGFKDVGFDVTFNKDGKPNKQTSALDFTNSTTADFWTLADIMEFIFQYYVPTTIASLETSVLNTSSYERIPTHLSLFGQTAVQAVNTIAELAGESWSLRPGDSRSEFCRVYPDGGTVRQVNLFASKSGGQAVNASERHASECNVALSVENVHDKYQVFSSLIVKESVMTNTGSDPLLTRVANFKHKEYAARFTVDVSKYEANNLGKNLSSGAQPKAWLTDLVTREKSDGSGYHTAAEITANEALLKNKRADVAIWISLDGTEANAKLCVGKYKIDVKHALIDFEARPEIMDDKGKGRHQVDVTDWSTIGIWMTVATVLETPEIVVSAEDAFLPDSQYELINKTDLVPERRQNSWLPDLSVTDNPNAISKLATSAEEKYVDVTARLTEVIDSSLAQSPEVESPIDIVLPFYPVWQVGDKVTIAGRDSGANGNEVITAITFNVHHDYETRIQASNVMKSIDPEKFIQKRKL